MHPDPNNPWSFIKGLEPVSFCDWPGRTSLVLFTGTCNLRCPTCHNPDLARRPQILPGISREALLQRIRSKGGWIDGVVISGGEPTAVPGLEHILEAIADLGLLIKLDSNGFYPHVLESLLQRDLVALFAVDVKGPFDRYPDLTGNRADPEEARANLERIFVLAREWPERFFFRCTHVPGLTQEDLDIVRDYLPRTHTLNVQQYRHPPPPVDEGSASDIRDAETVSRETEGNAPGGA
ncbi:MAG: anaerobic ribonucleoside-triphosphate reductase activating protein [Desulfohalobiaceae bacterium]